MMRRVLQVPQMIRCVLLCMLEAVDGGLCLLDVLMVLEVLEVMRRVLPCMLEALKVMRRVLLCMVEVMEDESVCWRCRR